MCQMRNPRREQDSNSNMNLILQPPLVVVVQWVRTWEAAFYFSFVSMGLAYFRLSMRYPRTSTRLIPLTKQIQVIAFSHFLALAYYSLPYFLLSHLLSPSPNHSLYTKGKPTQMMFFYWILTFLSISLTQVADDVRINNEFICNGTKSKCSTSLLIRSHRLVRELTTVDLKGFL